MGSLVFAPVGQQYKPGLWSLVASVTIAAMRLFVGVTDGDWFELLARQASLEEVNFWQPGGNRLFKSLTAGELFLFKLHSPDDFIVGGGIFAHVSLLPVSLAWETFGIANGALTLEEMRIRIEKYRRKGTSREDYTIGCILLEQPFFLPREAWVPVPKEWPRQAVQGKGYEVESQIGSALYEAVQDALRGMQPAAIISEPEPPRYGRPTLALPRLGQGTFRVVVTDAYDRRCAATGERTLPVLEAAHIQPFAVGGPHRVQNGLLLRSDLHTLFDRGYVTVTPGGRLEVSQRIRQEFENGRDYYALHGNRVRVPSHDVDRPLPALLAWHNENVFLG
jgi:putative restriction endonuclease